MSKAVLISIRPEWVEKIASGEKTIEVRKTRPNLPTPFKVYLYVTAGSLSYKCPNGMIAHCNGGREVIGEFVCDHCGGLVRVEFDGDNSPSRYFARLDDWRYVLADEILPAAQLTREELETYLAGDDGYGWHISGLRLYDKPRQLGDFFRLCAHEDCDGRFWIGTCEECVADRRIKRPPQSWMYVEEI